MKGSECRLVDLTRDPPQSFGRCLGRDGELHTQGPFSQLRGADKEVVPLTLIDVRMTNKGYQQHS